MRQKNTSILVVILVVVILLHTVPSARSQAPRLERTFSYLILEPMPNGKWRASNVSTPLDNLQAYLDGVGNQGYEVVENVAPGSAFQGSNARGLLFRKIISSGTETQP